jgi:GTP cyclohydrolase FolE2
MRCQVDAAWGSEECTLLREAEARVQTKVITPKSARIPNLQNCAVKNAVVRVECTQDGGDAMLAVDVDRAAACGHSILARSLSILVGRCEG